MSEKLTDEEARILLQVLINAFKEINRLYDDSVAKIKQYLKAQS